MKTYHNEANTSGITKIAPQKNWTLSVKLDRFRKITILRPNFRNKFKIEFIKKMLLTIVGVLN